MLPLSQRRVIIFGDNGKEHVTSTDNICITSSTFRESGLLVDGLKHNLLSISQLYNKDFKVVSGSLMCIVSSPIDDAIILIGLRYYSI